MDYIVVRMNRAISPAGGGWGWKLTANRLRLPCPNDFGRAGLSLTVTLSGVEG
jgi:hypothetical protein